MINRVLEDNGVSVEKFDAAMAAQRTSGSQPGSSPAAGAVAKEKTLVALLEKQLTGKGTHVDVTA